MTPEWLAELARQYLQAEARRCLEAWAADAMRYQPPLTRGIRFVPDVRVDLPC